MVLGRSPGLTNTMCMCGKQASHISLLFMAFASSDRSLSVEHGHLSASHPPMPHHILAHHSGAGLSGAALPLACSGFFPLCEFFSSCSF